MNNLYLKIGIIASFTMAVVAVVTRSIWEMVDPPNVKAMIIFIPLVIALLGTDALVVYLTIKPSLKKLTKLPVVIGITFVLTGGLIAGVTHFIRFIISSQAQLLISKVIGSFILGSSLLAYLLLVWLFWSLWRKRNSDVNLIPDLIDR
jgi:hypothetical protein